MLFLTYLIFFCSILSTISAYDHLNEDPEVADAGGAIACDNLLPQFAYLPPGAIPPEGLTLLEVCAQTQYGGLPLPQNDRIFSNGPEAHGDPIRNAGGYCNETLGRIQFLGDVQDTYQSEGTDLENLSQRMNMPIRVTRRNRYRLRLLAYCTLRCRCIGIPPSEVRPLQYEPSTNLAKTIELDRLEKILNLGWNIVPNALVINWISYPEAQIGSNPLIGVDPDHRIICMDRKPTFRLPAPATREDVNSRSVLELCAVASLGGNPKMNAGAFCHRQFDPWTRKPIAADVWFSDEMTPLVNWTWSFGDFDPYSPRRGSPPAALLLRQHCWKFCRCLDERWRKRQIAQSMVHVWPYIVGNIENSEWYLKSDKSRSKHASSDISGLSLSDDVSKPVLESLRGLLPPEIEKSLEVMRGMSSSSSTCDDRCHSRADCVVKSSSSCPFQPQCRVDPQSLTQTVVGGLGTINYAYTTFMCLPKHSRSSLSSRDINSIQKMEMNTWPCACNATYVSHSCCESEMGQVWEEPTDFLGGSKI